MKEPISLYLDIVKKYLTGSNKSKQDVLKVFQRDLLDYHEENPQYTLDDLHAEFGNPKDVAEQLIESIDEKEIEKIHKRKRNRLYFTFGLLSVVIGALIFLFYQSTIIMPDETKITVNVYEEENSLPTNENEGGQND